MRGNNNAAIVIAVVVALATLWGGQAFCQDAQAPEPSGTSVTIDAKDVDIAEVLRMLGKAGGVNIVVGQNVQGSIDTINLHDVDIETALRIIAEAQGLYWYKEGNVYVVTGVKPVGRLGNGEQTTTTEPKPVSAPAPQQPVGVQPGQPPAAPPQQAPPAAAIPEPPMPGGEGRVEVTQPAAREKRIITQWIPLKYANAAEIAAMFGGTVADTGGAGGLNLPTPASARRRAWAVYGSPHVSTGAGRSRGQAGGWEQWGGIGGEVGPGGQGYYGVGGRGRYGGAAGGFGGYGGYGGIGGRGGFGGFGGRGGFGGFGGGLGGGELFMLPGQMQPPIAFMPQNALIVKGLPEEIDEFREIVNFLDQPVPQVEVSVKFVNLNVTELKSWGIDWSVSNGQLEVFNLGFAPSEAVNNVVRFARGRFEAYLSAARQSGRARVLAEPIVTTQQNLGAEINFYTEIPYFAATVTYNEFGQREVDFETDFIYVNNMLYVTPRVNADDTVTMEVLPEIDQQVGTVEGPNGERVPITSNWYIYVPQVRVADGDTLVIGGIISKTVDEQFRYTPLLSEIPLIGDLFKSRRRSVSDTETLIFVTPRIVRELPRE
ncbi:MAG: hypothetical protein H5T86_01730 [Armatimonadetes bacterium]|nr:hypothetical protein [Armatimonadota bacterium]